MVQAPSPHADVHHVMPGHLPHVLVRMVIIYTSFKVKALTFNKQKQSEWNSVELVRSFQHSPIANCSLVVSICVSCR